MLKLLTYASALVVLSSLIRVQAALVCPPLSPPPAGEVCGVRGRISSPKSALHPNTCVHMRTSAGATGGAAVVDSLQTCRDYCLDLRFIFDDIINPQEQKLPYRFCYTFAFNTTSNLCSLYYQVPRVQDNPFGTNDTHRNDNLGFTPDKSSDNVFYTVNCFKPCHGACPATLSENLFANPGWDDYSSTFFPWVESCPSNEFPSAVKIMPREDQSGNFLRLGNGDNIEGAVQLARAPCPMQKYLVKVDWRTTPGTKPSSDKILFIGDQTTNQVYLDSGSLKSAPANWNTAAVSLIGDSRKDPFASLDAGRVVMQIVGLNIDIDNAAFMAINETVDTAGANALQNPGFETGSLAPWLGFEGKHVRVMKPSLTEGQYAAYFYGLNATLDSTSIQQRNIPVTPFVPHVWHFDYKLTATRNLTETEIWITISSPSARRNSDSLFETQPIGAQVNFNKTTSFEYIFTPVSNTIDIDLIVGLYDLILDNNYIKQALV